MPETSSAVSMPLMVNRSTPTTAYGPCVDVKENCRRPAE
jgi:hypothetical protein